LDEKFHFEKSTKQVMNIKKKGANNQSKTFTQLHSQMHRLCENEIFADL